MKTSTESLVNPKFTLNEIVTATFQGAPVAALVFSIPFCIGFVSKLSDHMAVAKYALSCALVGAVFLYRKRGSINVVLIEKAKTRAEPGDSA